MNKKDLIIFLVLAYLMYKVHCLTKEQFSYQEPTQAIKNLGKLAKQLTKGGLTIPGNVNITGTLWSNNIKTNYLTSNKKITTNHILSNQDIQTNNLVTTNLVANNITADKNLHVDNIKNYKSTLIYIDSDIQTSGSISSGKMMFNQGACVPRIGHYYTLRQGVLTGDENNC